MPAPDSSQVFARAEIPAGGVASFATILVPVGAAADAAPVIASLKADFFPGGGGACAAATCPACANLPRECV